MALSYYSTTRPGALSLAMNSSTTQVPLVSAATFPDPAGPGNSEYSIILGYGSDREEVCTVTAKVGDTLTVIRGQDSTAATAKNQGDVVVHGVSARDFKGFAKTTDQPVAHAPSHATGGSDPVTPAAIGAATMAQVSAAILTAVPIGVILMWSGSVASIPGGWALCNGQNGTPNLLNRFIAAAGGAYAVGAPGGADTVTLSVANMPSHDHTGATTMQSANHTHHFPDMGDTISVDPGSFTAAVILSGTKVTTIEDAIHTHAIYAQGGGQAFDNRPLFYAMAYIMKIA